MRWSPERDVELAVLWADGALSASDIGDRLRVTRNAVLGRVHRLKLPGRRAIIDPEARTAARAARQDSAAEALPAVSARPADLAAPEPPRPDEDAQIAEYLATKGVWRPDREPDVDVVMNEIRRDGTVVVPIDDQFKSFRLNNLATIDRGALLARANKSRLGRGMPLWLADQVKWSRPAEPEHHGWRGPQKTTGAGPEKGAVQ